MKKDRQPPALFATIHFKSERRPNGYSADEIAELNRLANAGGHPTSVGEKKFKTTVRKSHKSLPKSIK